MCASWCCCDAVYCLSLIITPCVKLIGIGNLTAWHLMRMFSKYFVVVRCSCSKWCFTSCTCTGVCKTCAAEPTGYESCGLSWGTTELRTLFFSDPETGIFFQNGQKYNGTHFCVPKGASGVLYLIVLLFRNLWRTVSKTTTWRKTSSSTSMTPHCLRPPFFQSPTQPPTAQKSPPLLRGAFGYAPWPRPGGEALGWWLGGTISFRLIQGSCKLESFWKLKAHRMVTVCIIPGRKLLLWQLRGHYARTEIYCNQCEIQILQVPLKTCMRHEFTWHFMAQVNSEFNHA